MSRAIIKYWNLEDNQDFTVYRVDYDGHGATIIKVDKKTKKFTFDDPAKVPSDERYTVASYIFKAIKRDVVLPSGVAIALG